MNIPFVIYADPESLLEKICTHDKDTKIFHIKNKQTYDVWLFIIHPLFIWLQLKQTWFSWDKYSINKYCADLRSNISYIVNCERKKGMLPLTKQEKKSYKKQKLCHICKEEFNWIQLNIIVASGIIVTAQGNIRELLIASVI